MHTLCHPAELMFIPVSKKLYTRTFWGIWKPWKWKHRNKKDWGKISQCRKIRLTRRAWEASKPVTRCLSSCFVLDMNIWPKMGERNLSDLVGCCVIKSLPVRSFRPRGQSRLFSGAANIDFCQASCTSALVFSLKMWICTVCVVRCIRSFFSSLSIIIKIFHFNKLYWHDCKVTILPKLLQIHK